MRNLPDIGRHQDWRESDSRTGLFAFYRKFLRAIGHRRIAFPLRWLTVSSDRALYRLTKGRWTSSALAGIPSLTLLINRPNGVVMVPLQYLTLDGALYIVGTNWGREIQPRWSAWLQSGSECAVNIRGKELPCIAEHIVGIERPGVWREITALSPYLAQCQDRTRRELPVFRLRVAG